MKTIEKIVAISSLAGSIGSFAYLTIPREEYKGLSQVQATAYSIGKPSYPHLASKTLPAAYIFYAGMAAFAFTLMNTKD